MMKRFTVVILAFLVFSTSVFAENCYTPEQYRAEQALRFHTYLMVYGLYCKPIVKQNTYATYQDFTARNQNVVRGQENTLIAYFKEQQNRPAPERDLHSLRTDLANKTSLQASQSIIRFCRRYQPIYHKAKTMKPADFQHWIEQISVNSALPSNRRICGASQRGE